MGVHPTRAYPDAMLSPDQLAQYDRDGFLVLPDFVSDEACAELRARAVEIVDEWEPGTARTASSALIAGWVSRRVSVGSTRASSAGEKGATANSRAAARMC